MTSMWRLNSSITTGLHQNASRRGQPCLRNHAPLTRPVRRRQEVLGGKKMDDAECCEGAY